MTFALEAARPGSGINWRRDRTSAGLRVRWPQFRSQLFATYLCLLVINVKITVAIFQETGGGAVDGGWGAFQCFR